MPRVTSVVCHSQSNMVTRVKLLYESQFGPHLLI